MQEGVRRQSFPCLLTSPCLDRLDWPKVPVLLSFGCCDLFWHILRVEAGGAIGNAGSKGNRELAADDSQTFLAGIYAYTSLDFPE